jgi:hypothetical protein
VWPRSPQLCALRCKSIGRSRRLPSCRDRPGLPRGRRAALAPVFESYARLAHRSRRGGAAACVSTSCGDLFGQCRGVHFPCGSSSASGTGVRRTDFCLLTSSYEHPRLVGSRCVTRGNAPARPGRSPASRQCDSLRRAARPFWVIAAGVVFPWRCVPAVPLAPLSLLSRRTLRSRANGPSSEKPRSSPSRSRERCVLEERPEVPSIDREPSPRDALSSARLRPCADAAVWPPRCRTSTTFARADPLGSVRARPPFTRPVASGVALLWVSASLADFCNR